MGAHASRLSANVPACVVQDPLHRIVCCCHIEPPSASEHLIDLQTQQRKELGHVFVLANPEAKAALMTGKVDLSSCVQRIVTKPSETPPSGTTKSPRQMQTTSGRLTTSERPGPCDNPQHIYAKKLRETPTNGTTKPPRQPEEEQTPPQTQRQTTSGRPPPMSGPAHMTTHKAYVQQSPARRQPTEP